jgi:hypothetical protein
MSPGRVQTLQCTTMHCTERVGRPDQTETRSEVGRWITSFTKSHSNPAIQQSSNPAIHQSINFTTPMHLYTPTVLYVPSTTPAPHPHAYFARGCAAADADFFFFNDDKQGSGGAWWVGGWVSSLSLGGWLIDDVLGLRGCSAYPRYMLRHPRDHTVRCTWHAWIGG